MTAFKYKLYISNICTCIYVYIYIYIYIYILAITIIIVLRRLHRSFCHPICRLSFFPSILPDSPHFGLHYDIFLAVLRYFLGYYIYIYIYVQYVWAYIYMHTLCLYIFV